MSYDSNNYDKRFGVSPTEAGRSANVVIANALGIWESPVDVR